MIVIPFEKAHISAVIKLQDRCFSDGWTENQFLSAMESGRFFGFCAYDGEVLAGFIALSKNYDDCDLDLIVVSPEFRRKGLAELLIQKATDKIKELGLNAVLLEVRETNLPAKGLYKKVGFKEISVRKKYYPDGENAVVMQRGI